jgi:aryl-alcohol dehydrogenase-like predicted oxidoreductase
MRLRRLFSTYKHTGPSPEAYENFYTKLGHTKIDIGRIGLGAMSLSMKGRPSEAISTAIIHRAIDLGVTFIDTADSYCLDHHDMGHNERLIASALRTYRGAGPVDKVVVGTKGGFQRPKGGWKLAGDPASLRKACMESLKNLGLTTLPLYQLHAPDPSQIWEVQVEGIAQLQDDGLIQHIGLCNVTPTQLDKALEMIDVVSVQNRLFPYDAESKEAQGETMGMIEYCHEKNITFIGHSVFGGVGAAAQRESMAQMEFFKPVADDIGCSVLQIWLWAMAHSGSNVVVIPGARTVATVESSVQTMFLGLEKHPTLEQFTRPSADPLQGPKGI